VLLLLLLLPARRDLSLARINTVCLTAITWTRLAEGQGDPPHPPPILPQRPDDQPPAMTFAIKGPSRTHPAESSKNCIPTGVGIDAPKIPSYLASFATFGRASGPELEKKTEEKRKKKEWKKRRKEIIMTMKGTKRKEKSPRSAGTPGHLSRSALWLVDGRTAAL
jgi:hypothetical protein